MIDTSAVQNARVQTVLGSGAQLTAPEPLEFKRYVAQWPLRKTRCPSARNALVLFKSFTEALATVIGFITIFRTVAVAIARYTTNYGRHIAI